ncbi:MAG: hypothetical protein KJ767_01935 [Nanoarchaeota archaeon]|nr:hypothetical protein [Nanoarchaeota archaeon]
MNSTNQALEERILRDELKWISKGELIGALKPLISNYFFTKGKLPIEEVEDITLERHERRRDNTKSNIYELTAWIRRYDEAVPTPELFFLKKYRDDASSISDPKIETDIEEKKSGLLDFSKSPLINLFKLPLNALRKVIDIDSPEEGYEIEKAILTVATKNIPLDDYSFANRPKIQLFPQLLSIGGTAANEFDLRKILLLEKIGKKSLEERFLEKEHADWRCVVPALNPVILLHQKLPQYEDEIYSLLHPNGKRKQRIERFDKDYYLRKFSKYVSILANKDAFLSKKTDIYSKEIDEENTKKAFNLIAESLMEPKNPKMVTFIQKDGYPWHNMIESLVDAGGVVHGHRAFHLGTLIGHPSIFLKLEDRERAIKEITKSYIERWALFDPSIKEYGERELLDELSSVIYSSAIYSNLRLAAGRLILNNGNGSIKPLFRTVKEQIDYFGDKGKPLLKELQKYGILEN